MFITSYRMSQVRPTTVLLHHAFFARTLKGWIQYCWFDEHSILELSAGYPIIWDEFDIREQGTAVKLRKRLDLAPHSLLDTARRPQLARPFLRYRHDLEK